MDTSYFHWNIDPIIVKLGIFQLRYYALCFVGGIMLATMVINQMLKNEKVSTELLYPLVIYVVVGIIVGARLVHCIFYDPVYYLTHPIEMLFPIAKNAMGNYEFVGYRGLASHGGAIGILTAAWFYARKYKVGYLWIVDRLAIVAALVGFFIRLGNFFNSEIIGKASTLPWAIVFDHVDATPRHPAQLYEALCYLAIFLFLIVLYKNNWKRAKSGIFLGWFLALTFTARFFLEFLKEVQESFEEGLTFDMGQLLSIPFIIIGIVFIVKKWGWKKGTAS